MNSDTSQYGEGQVILDHFAGRDPAGLRFLDIGAFDGKTFSNTWPLVASGWSGICVEPSPPAFCHLMATYADNPRITLVNACVVAAAKPLAPFWVSRGGRDAGPTDADMVGTMDGAHRATWADHTNYREIVMPQLSLGALLDWLDGISIDFVNIDVEGQNARLLSALLANRQWAPPDMICYEWDKAVDGDAPVEWLREAGYATRVVGNLLAWRVK